MGRVKEEYLNNLELPWDEKKIKKSRCSPSGSYHFCKTDKKSEVPIHIKAPK